MAGALSVAAKNTMLDAFGTTYGYTSAHTASPGSSGANEVTGGSPAYARKAITWNGASGAAKTASNQPTFDVPSGTTITHIGFWTALTGGTFGGYVDVADQAFTAQGTYQLTNCSIDENTTDA